MHGPYGILANQLTVFWTWPFLFPTTGPLSHRPTGDLLIVPIASTCLVPIQPDEA